MYSRDLRIVFFRSNRIFESNRPYTMQAVTQPNPSVFCICDEREWCTDYVLVYFNSVIKRIKQCCCTLILLPKSTLNANLTTTNRFFTNDDWQRGRFENFKSDHQYELNLELDVRFEIESNHEASQVPNVQCLGLNYNNISLEFSMHFHSQFWVRLVASKNMKYALNHLKKYQHKNEKLLKMCAC